MKKCLVHDRRTVRNNGVHVYRECVKCGLRDHYTISQGYQPLEKRWLAGGAFDEEPPAPPKTGSGVKK